MAKMGLHDFMKDSKGSNKAKIVDWKDKGQISVFLHPATGIEKRSAHWAPVYKEVEDEKTKKKKWIVASEQFICPGYDDCAFCQLRAKLRDNEEIDDDTVILIVGEGKAQVEYMKGDILRIDGFDWKKDLSYKKEYLFGVVNANKPSAPEVMITPVSLGKKLTKEIEKQIEEEGEEAGDPFTTPYAFKFTYDEEASPNDKYDASRTNKVKLNDEIQQFLDMEELDLSGLTEQADPGVILKLVHGYVDAADEELWEQIGIEIEVEEKEMKPRKSAKSTTKKEEVEEPVEKAEKTKVKKTSKIEEAPPAEEKKKKVSKKTKPPVKMIPCPECEKDIPEDAKECPHCGVEFEDEDTIKCPHCEKEIPIGADTCPECGEDVIPF